MGIGLHITSVERVRYLLPLTDNELNGLMSFMAKQVGLGDYVLELSLLDDAAMAELHFSTMGTLNTTNILSFPLLYGTFAPYVMVESQEHVRAGESAKGGFGPNEFRSGESGLSEFRPNDFKIDESTAENPRPRELECHTPSQGQFIHGSVTPMNEPPLPVPMLGSLAMAVETVQREAFLYGQELDAYTVFLLAHGFAHLLGYDHGTAMDALIGRMEQGALESLGAA